MLETRLCTGPGCKQQNSCGVQIPLKYFNANKGMCIYCIRDIRRMEVPQMDDKKISCGGPVCQGKLLSISLFGDDLRNKKRYGKKSYCRRCESRRMMDYQRSRPNCDAKKKQYNEQYWAEHKFAEKKRRIERKVGLRPQNRSYPYINDGVVER